MNQDKPGSARPCADPGRARSLSEPPGTVDVKRDQSDVGVPSPCVNVCNIDPASGLCEGCSRSLDEIAAWPSLDAAQKRALLLRLQSRKRGK